MNVVVRFCFYHAPRYVFGGDRTHVLADFFGFFCLWRTKRKTKKSPLPTHQNIGHALIGQMHKTIRHYFPDLFDRMDHLDDKRERKEYRCAELLMASVMMFLFKEGSRNAFNNEGKTQKFRDNYYRLFGLRLPHMDTVEDLLRMLHPQELEKLKAALVGELIERRVFHKFKFLGKRFVVAIDGTGVCSFDHRHCAHCLHKTSSTGKTIYFHQVLEAKLVTSNGLSISLATEWVANEGERNFDKQDCEHKAFQRLAVKMKKFFPRLPVCIAADGLYPNQYFFATCLANGWDFIVTLQDGNLPSLQEEIQLLLPLVTRSAQRILTKKNVRTTQTYQWINGLEHKNTTIHWMECKEETLTTALGKKSGQVETARFVHVTNLEVTSQTVCQLSDGGRLRWKIENEGFNTQKNGGYRLEHKYSRVSFGALKNYYQCLQIAHLINQLIEKSTPLTALLSADNKLTLAHLWKILKGLLAWTTLDENELLAISQKRWQIRLTG